MTIFRERPLPSDIRTNAIQAVTFEAAGLGDRSYLIHDGDIAIVVDPQREPERYLDAAADLGVAITHVFETHVHNDYVSGGLALARELEATYVVPKGESYGFAAESSIVGDGETVSTGSLTISALSTPGHTSHHLSYHVRPVAGGPGFVCSGGAVLPGGVGRTDLLGADRAVELATAQWHSARRLLTELDEATTVLPTHGFGSFCSATPKLAATTESFTIAVEHARNITMRMGLEDFVERLCRDVPPIPTYYRYMAPINRKGSSAPNFGPLTRIDQATLERFLHAGGAVTDLRSRRAFAGEHWRGAWNIELGANLTTYFGWLLPFEAPYLLIAASVDDVEQSRRLLARIHREEAGGFALAEDLDPGRAQRYRVATFPDLARAIDAGDDPFVVDVRHRSEWRDAHLVSARHIPLPDLARERSALPSDAAIWVHCAAGFRAAIAASQLSGWGFSPVLIDDQFDHVEPSGLTVTTGD